MPTQKMGNACPSSANVLPAKSHTLPRLTADSTPSGMPISVEIMYAATASRSVGGSLSRSLVDMGCLSLRSCPKVSAQDVGYPEGVLEGNGLVQMQLLPRLFQFGGVQPVALLRKEQDCRVAQNPRRAEYDYRRAYEGEYGGEDASDDKCGHDETRCREACGYRTGERRAPVVN